MMVETEIHINEWINVEVDITEEHISLFVHELPEANRVDFIKKQIVCNHAFFHVLSDEHIDLLPDGAKETVCKAFHKIANRFKLEGNE